METWRAPPDPKCYEIWHTMRILRDDVGIKMNVGMYISEQNVRRNMVYFYHGVGIDSIPSIRIFG